MTEEGGREEETREVKLPPGLLEPTGLAAVKDLIEDLQTRIEELEEEVRELKYVMSSEGELERWRMEQQRQKRREQGEE
jgi:hypothetical protein